MTPITINRRHFLTMLGGAAAASFINSELTHASSDFIADIELKLTAHTTTKKILPGKPTDVFSYKGTVIKGDPASLQAIPGAYLGPVLRLHKGQRVRIVFENDIGFPSIIHWHGMHMPPEMDGHPRYAVNSGQTFIYEFIVSNRAGTYWFHPHPHEQTAEQVIMGLAGLLIITDDEEQTLKLPKDSCDLPIVIQDRSFDQDNQWKYIGSGMLGMMQRMTGFMGDQILINGTNNATLEVDTRAYRLRLLNGSNSRIYRLAWSDGNPLTVIATDGGLLNKPERKESILLAPGERVDLWVDFSHHKLGTELSLVHLPIENSTTQNGMMRRMMSNTLLAVDESFSVVNIKVKNRENAKDKLPEKLSDFSFYDRKNVVKHRIFKLTMEHMKPGINYRSFDMLEVAKDEIVKFNSLEIWEFQNDASNGMAAMPHPIHIHGLQFQILERTVAH
ncbi:MAG: multicopper oxidase domain-containing protein, partial [Gammaproteobacteria bacterium]|nr:multicopper oxidase domain-containing protein [Gammaproteobacteria bacterium]